jgi:hypothetical protein
MDIRMEGDVGLVCVVILFFFLSSSTSSSSSLVLSLFFLQLSDDGGVALSYIIFLAPSRSVHTVVRRLGSNQSVTSIPHPHNGK